MEKKFASDARHFEVPCGSGKEKMSESKREEASVEDSSARAGPHRDGPTTPVRTYRPYVAHRVSVTESCC